MVSRIVAALLPLAVLMGCAEGDTGAEGSDEGQATSDAGTKADPTPAWTPPAPVGSTDPAAPVPSTSSSTTPTPSGTTPTPGGTTTAPPVPVEKSTSCVASKTEGSDVLRSEVTLFFLPAATGTNVTLKRFQIIVKNPFGNDKNDADISSVTGTAVAKLFNTGDVLKNNVKVTVDAGNRVLNTTQKVRVSTNFDKSLAGDPSAACDLSLN